MMTPPDVLRALREAQAHLSQFSVASPSSPVNLAWEALARAVEAAERAESDAPALRSAEEVAAEMVQPMTREERIDGEFRMLVRAGGWQTEVSTRAPDTLRRVVAAAIEQASAEGAAAERNAATDRAAAQIREEWRLPAVSHYREGLHRIWRGDPNPQAIACSYLGEDDPSQPRDIAGRIRALVQEYAGRWADAEGYVEPRMRDIMGDLRRAHLRAKYGLSVAGVIASMRAKTGKHFRRAAADELEAIVRECEEHR